ncbi:MAG: glycosyltransferase [Deltaproteobacteria bacterium]|nr:glycosyltransferase [Deltaproteobacteria bacterium]
MSALQLTTVFCASDQPVLPQLIAASPETWPERRLLKHDKGTTVTVVKPSAVTAIVIKHHRVFTWKRWIDVLVHGSPARRAWRGAQFLQAHGFPIPRPLGVFEHRAGGMVRESWYCSEGLLTQLPLNQYWRQQQRWSLRQRRAFLRALAEFLRTFHQAGLYAGDMRDANLLVEDNGDAQWKFYLVDFDRILQTSVLSVKRRQKNLVQLERTLGRSAHVSERLFFLHCYWGAALPSRFERRQFIQQLLQLRRQKDREYAQRRQKRYKKQAATQYAKAAFATASPLTREETTARASLSCFIICFNEENNIRRCLESVQWCDEIIIVDSFSTDRTLEICREYTSHIFQRPWPGYVTQKRFALGQTTQEWVLNIDADEEVSPELRHEILFVLQQNDQAVDGFYLPRLVHYLGRWWKHGWYPGHRLRLFRRTKVHWGGVDPHEKALLRGHADFLYGDLYHYTYRDISHHLRTVNSLTEVAAHEKQRRGKQAHVSDLLLRPVWRFLRFYLLSGTVRYGVPGFFAAVTSAVYVFLKYAKLWEHTSARPSQPLPQDSPPRPGESLGRRRSASHGADNLSA